MASAVADCDQSPGNNNYVTPYSVIFQDFSERVPVHDRTISFTYQTLSQSAPQYGDWIGLFRGAGSNPEPSDYVSYIGAKEGSISLNNNSYKASLLLDNNEELDVNTSYQLIYVTTGCSIIGCSQRFWFRDGLCSVRNASSPDVSSLVCKCCQPNNNKHQDMCSNGSSDNSCNISQNSSSESLRALRVDSRDFVAHGRLAFQNLSEWLAFMSNAGRQNIKLHKPPVRAVGELWHTDPKVIANRSRQIERSDCTNSNNITSKIKFSMGDKNSLSMAESKKLSDVEVDKENDVTRTLLFGAEDCTDIINSKPRITLRRLATDDYKKKPLMMVEETCSKDQTVRKSNSAELVLSEKIKPQSSSSSVDIFTEAVCTDDAFNTLYLKLNESESKLKSLAEELRMSALTVESREIEIKQYKSIMNLQTEELRKHLGTIQSQSLMLLQYRDKMDAQLSELKNLREKTESSICELKGEKEKNKLLTKELDEANGRIKLQSSELEMRCSELQSFKTLAETLSKELNEVKDQEVARSSEMLLLKQRLEADSSDLRRLKERETLDSAELQHLRKEVQLKSAELALVKDKDKSQSEELKLLQDQLRARSGEVGSLEETIQSQSLELTQLKATMAYLTMQADTDRTALAESLKELEVKEKEIKRRKQQEEEQRLEVGQHQANMERLLAEIKLRDTKEKKMEDKLKEISDAFQLCRAQEIQQLEKDLDKSKAEEEIMSTELTRLRAEKKLVSDAMDQLKAEKELLVRELHQSKSSNKLLIEESKKHKLGQEQTSSACFRARINAGLLSRALEKLRSKEECTSDELKNSNERLKSISQELMLSKEREEHLLQELAQLRANGKLQECHHISDEELQKMLQQRKVISNSLSSGQNQSLVNGILISNEVKSNELLATELEESKANAAEQSKHLVVTLADESLQNLASPTLISRDLKMTPENQTSLAAELESSKLMKLQGSETKCSVLAADQKNSLNSLPLISSDVEEMQMSKGALVIELDKSKANEAGLYSNLPESKVKQDTFGAKLKTRAKIIEDKKQLATSSDVVMQNREHAVIEEEETSLIWTENEERFSAELLTEMKQSKANEELMSIEPTKCKSMEELLSAKLTEQKANETRLDAVAIGFKGEKSKTNEEILSFESTECKVKEEISAADLKESKTSEETLMAELKQSKASEERLSIELKKSRERLENLTSDLTRIRQEEELAVADLKDFKEREAVLSAELYLHQIDQESIPTQSEQYDISSASLLSKLEEYKIKEEMLATKLRESKAKAEILSAELKKSTVSDETLSGELKEYDVTDDIIYAGHKQSKTSKDFLANDLEKCKEQENVILAELKKIKSSEERLSLELKQREVCRLLHSDQINKLQNYAACHPSGLLPEKTKSAASQGLVGEARAGHCQPKRSCQAFGEMSQSAVGEEVSTSLASLVRSKSLSHVAIIEQFQKKIAAQSEEILQYKEKIELLLYKNLLSVNQNRSNCEDLPLAGIKASRESVVAQRKMSMVTQRKIAKKGRQTVDILFEQLRKEQEFREDLFTLHDMKNKELVRQIAALNNLVITSQHQMENISQIWREPGKRAETDDDSKLLQGNNLAVDAINQNSVPSKFQSDSSDKAYFQADHSQKIKNSYSGANGHDHVETMMAGKRDHRLSRSADFQKCATTGRKKNKPPIAFNSRVMNSTEAFLKKVDLRQNCDDNRGLSLKKLDAKSYENCDDKQSLSCDDKKSQEHLSKSLVIRGAEIDRVSISADGELVASVEDSESRRAHRKGYKRPSLSRSPKTVARKFSVLKGKPFACKKVIHFDKSKVHPPDQLSASTMSQLAQKECSQRYSTDFHKSTSHNYCKTDMLKADMPSKLTSKRPQSPSKTADTTNSTSLNNLVEKAGNNQGPKKKGLKTARRSVVQRPKSAAPQTGCNPRSKAKRSYTALKQLTNNINSYLDSVVVAYPEKISLDVVNYFAADDLAQDFSFRPPSQDSKNNCNQNDPDLWQRNETLPSPFPISSEMFSVMTNRFVERITDGHLEIPDKSNMGIEPKCEAKTSSRQLTVLKFPNSQSVESSGNFNMGDNVGAAGLSIPENNPMSSSASMFSDSVEPSDHGSRRSTSTQKSRKDKYAVQDDKSHSRSSLETKTPWCSNTQSQSSRPMDTVTGRRNGLGYACSSSLQKQLDALKTDQSQAKLGDMCRNPRLLTSKSLMTKPGRGKGGYAAMAAKQVSWNADGKSQNFPQSPRHGLPMKYCKEDAEMSITME